MYYYLFNNTGNLRGNNHVACAYLHCENEDSCVHRTFRCKDPPCPSMLYCAKSPTGKQLNELPLR